MGTAPQASGAVGTRPATDTAAPGALCPVCRGATLSAPLRRVGRYSLLECGACGVQFWHPCERLGSSWYESSYAGRLRAIPPLEPGHRYFLADSRRPRGGRLLDIGCGVGNFMHAARKAGFQVTGIDWDSKAVQIGRDILGLDSIHASSLEEYAAAHNGETFDVVSFFEVLEHQDDPAGFLSRVRTFLKPGGHIALSVPNRDRWQVGLDTTDCPPNHLTRWSAAVLGRFLVRNGFEVVSCREEPISLTRAASMLSAAVPSGLARKVMGGTPPNSTELAEMPPEQIAAYVQRASRLGRMRVGSILVRCKQRLFLVPAALCLPYLRRKGCRGVYLYCLARDVHGGERGNGLAGRMPGKNQASAVVAG